MLVVLSVAGCGSGGGGSSAVVRGRTAVTLSFGQVRTVSPATHRIATKSIPLSVVKLKVSISAPDMVPIGQEVLTEGRDAVSVSLIVPNGVNRLFEVEAMDAADVVLYRGETFADLNGRPATITVSMVSSDPLPPAFGGLSGFTSVTQTSAVLSWPQASDSVTPAAKIQYLIYMTTGAGGENFDSPSYTTAPGQNSYEVTGLSPSRTYYFVVRAMDEKGNIDKNTIELALSTPAPPDSVPPSFGGLTSVNGISASEVTLSWTNASDNETAAPDIVYLVYMAAASGAENLGVPSFTTSPGVGTFTIGGLTEGASYFFVVRARDKAGNIDGNTVERSAGPLDKTPPRFGGLAAAVASSPTGMDLTWAAAADNVSQPSAISYPVYVATSSGGQNFAAPTATARAGATSLFLTGMTPGSLYYVVVRARDAAGNIDSNTVEKSVLMPLPPDTVPPVFAGVASVSVSGTDVTLSWNPATDTVGVAGYNIYVATGPGAENFSAPTMTAPAGTTSINYPAPGGAITYYFLVRATDAAGNIDGNLVELSATTDVFVNAVTGSDIAGAGTLASPFRTITKALAISSGKPGVTINAAGGTHNTAIGETFPLNFAGTSGRTLNCTPSAPPATTGTLITSAGSGQTAIFGGPGTTILNCTITGDNTAAAISYNGGNITVQNCVIDGQGATLNCLELGGAETITGSSIMNCRQFGVVVSLAGSPTISGNIIRGNGVGVRLFNTSSPAINANTISANTTGISSDTTSGATISGNKIFGNTVDGIVFNTPGASSVLNNTVCGNGAMGININHSIFGAVEPAIHNNRIFQNIGADLRTWALVQVDATNNSWDNAPPGNVGGTCTGGVDTCNASFPALVNPYLGAVGTTICP